MTLNTKTGFEIGWDHYAHTLLLPCNLTPEEFDLTLLGFRAAKQRNVPQIPHDRFVRKWLHLRLNAWRRSRTFDASVIPELIKRIDVSHCPITKIKLTYGAGAESDWSVDRVSNNAGYAPGNLVIVSSLANIAKSNYNYEEITRFASNKEIALPAGKSGLRALTKMEWMRWRSISSHVIVSPEDDSIHYDIAPCVCVPPRNIPMNASSALQMSVGLFVVEAQSKPLNGMLACLPKPKRSALNQIVARAKKTTCRGMRATDIWFHERLFAEMHDFFYTLDKNDFNAIAISGQASMCCKKAMTCAVENWNVENNGYDEPVTYGEVAHSHA